MTPVGSGNQQLPSLKDAKEQPSSAVLKAAREFEALFLTHMLKGLERTGRVAGGSDSGQQVYGSMAVEAVSDAIARSGGIGLADQIAKAITASNSVIPKKPNT